MFVWNKAGRQANNSPDYSAEFNIIIITGSKSMKATWNLNMCRTSDLHACSRVVLHVQEMWSRAASRGVRPVIPGYSENPNSRVSVWRASPPCASSITASAAQPDSQDGAANANSAGADCSGMKAALRSLRNVCPPPPPRRYCPALSPIIRAGTSKWTLRGNRVSNIWPFSSVWTRFWMVFRSEDTSGTSHLGVLWCPVKNCGPCHVATFLWGLWGLHQHLRRPRDLHRPSGFSSFPLQNKHVQSARDGERLDLGRCPPQGGATPTSPPTWVHEGQTVYKSEGWGGGGASRGGLQNTEFTL